MVLIQALAINAKVTVLKMHTLRFELKTKEKETLTGVSLEV